MTCSVGLNKMVQDRELPCGAIEAEPVYLKFMARYWLATLEGYRPPLPSCYSRDQKLIPVDVFRC